MPSFHFCPLRKKKGAWVGCFTQWTGRDSDRLGTSPFHVGSGQSTLSRDSLERASKCRRQLASSGAAPVPRNQPAGNFRPLVLLLLGHDAAQIPPFLPHWDHLPAPVRLISSSCGPLWLNWCFSNFSLQNNHLLDLF